MKRDLSEGQKYCPRCDRYLPFIDFGIDRSNDGHQSYCKVCVRKYHKERYKKNNRKEYFHQHYEKDPRKHAAKRDAGIALKKGEIIPPDSCELCDGDTPWRDMHHDDYSKPLEVRFLCRPCHMILHANEDS